MSESSKIKPGHDWLAHATVKGSRIDTWLTDFNAATPSVGRFMANAGITVTPGQLISYPLAVKGGELISAIPGAISVSTPTQGAFNFGEALKDYQVFTLNAGVAGRFELSAMNMLTHVILDENIVVDSALLEEIVSVTAARRRELKEQIANIEAFEARLRSLLTGAEEQKRIPGDGALEKDAYWTRVKGDLQQWFSMSLEDLADVISIAKATLVYIDRPGRHPRPSTSRKVMDLHALGSAVVSALGVESGRTWLATTGLSELRSGGVALLDRAVSRMLYGRRPSEEATVHAQVVEDFDTQPYAPPKNPEASAF